MGRHVQEDVRHEQVNVGTGRQRARWADTFKRTLDTSRLMLEQDDRGLDGQTRSRGH